MSDKTDKLLLDIAALIQQRLGTDAPAPGPSPIPPTDPVPPVDPPKPPTDPPKPPTDNPTPPIPPVDPPKPPVIIPIPIPGDMEPPPEGAIRVTNVAEFKTALLAMPPVVAVQCGVYDMGSEEWKVDHYSPRQMRVLGGYNEHWQRPRVLPSPLAKYDPATGDTILPQRLYSFLTTGKGETVITRSGNPPERVGVAVWSQIRGELNRVTFMGTKDHRTAQPYVIQGGARLTTLFKDVMTIQRYNNSHAYLTFNYFGGQPSVIDGGIFYQPFVGLTGNCRPQFLIGSSDDPALIYDQHVEMHNTCLLMPVNGGYHRLGLTGGTSIIRKSQFLSPASTSWLNGNSPRQLGVIAADMPTVKDVDWRTEWHDNEFVFSSFTTAPVYTRKLYATHNIFYCKKGFDGPNAALWADQAMDFGRTNLVRLEQGDFFPPESESLFQDTGAPRVSRSRGYYKNAPIWRDDGTRYNLPVCFAGDGSGPFHVSPTILQAAFRAVRYPHLTITPTAATARMQAGGEAECPKIFDEQHPALANIP